MRKLFNRVMAIDTLDAAIVLGFAATIEISALRYLGLGVFA